MAQIYASPFVGYKTSNAEAANLVGDASKKIYDQTSLRYSKFGVNLGPSRAIIPSEKFLRNKYIQSPNRNMTFPELTKKSKWVSPLRDVSISPSS